MAKAPKTITIQLPKLTGYQLKVHKWLGDPFESGKIAVIKSVRQSGKSFFCLIKLIEMAFTHAKTVSVIFEPTLAQARVMYKLMEGFFEGSNFIKTANAQLLEIEFINGSSVLFKSTEQMNRSFTVSGLLILDECAYLSDEEIYTILPFVNAHNAPIIVASTPFVTEGYFYTMFTEGLKNVSRSECFTEDNSECADNEGVSGGEISVMTFDWSCEKEVERFLTPERKEFYRKTMSRAKFTTEVLGEFLTDDGLLFRNLMECVTTDDECTYGYVGIDFGGGGEGDYTVVSVINEYGHQYRMWRVNNLSPMEQVEWISTLLNGLVDEGVTIRGILAEHNGIGLVYIDALKSRLRNNLTITDWVTSNKSKQDLVTTLQIALENKQIGILNDPTQMTELRAYTQEINPKTKTITYNGKGAHDDTVIALMLSFKCFKGSAQTSTYTITSVRRKPRRKLKPSEKYR